MKTKGSHNLNIKVGDPYQNLANAIILVACDDLRDELSSQKLGYNKAAEISRLKQFFYSPWFEALSTLDGKMIYQKIVKEFE